MSGLDLSKFKKVSSDKSATTLKHDDGHVLKVAHDGLSKKLRAQLDKIPLHAAEGVDTENFDQTSSSQPVDTEASVVSDAQNAPVNPEYTNILGKLEAQGVGGLGGSAEDIAKSKFEALQDLRSKASGELSPMDDQHKANLESMAKADESRGLAQAEEPAPTQPAPQDDQEPGDQSITQAKAPDVTQPQTVPSQATGPTAEYEEKEPPLNTPQGAKSFMQAQTSATEQDLANGHIRPETYADLFAKKSTLGKIGSIFGLMLGGFGSGLSHQSNALLEAMNNEIKNDLEAQKESSANTQNFLKINQEDIAKRAGANLNEQQAKSMGFAMAQTQMMQSSFHSLVNQVNKMPEGPQKQAAQQQLGMIYQQMGQHISNIQDAASGVVGLQSLLNPQGAGDQSNEQQFQQKSNALKMLGPQGEAKSKDLEAKHIPGISGYASEPLDKEYKDSVNSGIQFDQKLHRFIDWTKSHSGSLNPSDMRTGQAMAAELQGAYRQATHGGVYKEGEQNFISKIIDSNPTKFFNSIRVLPQLNAVANENKSRLDQLLISKGFKGYEAIQQRAQTEQSATQVKIVNGVKYMRGPNGEAVPVK